MKNVSTVLSLLVTAILCIGLVSCDRAHDQPEVSTSDATTSEETTAAYNGTTVEETSTETVSEAGTAKTTAVGTILQPTEIRTNDSTTAKVTTTTIPTVLKPVITTAAPVATTLPTTTAAPVTTTRAPETTVPITSQSDTTIVITDTEDKDLELAVIDLVNKERVAAGLPKLTASAELSKAASIRAKEIVESFGHMRPDGPLFNTVSSLAMGENIAKGHNTPQEVMNAWMNSDGHRKNMLNKQYTIIGVGCYYDQASNTYYWVQLFG